MEGASSKEAVKRRGIVYLYGFEWCNPNGDPSFDNEPRIFGEKIFITDVFLKRRIRDYVYSNCSNTEVFLREIIKENGKRITPEERVKELIEDVKDKDLNQIKQKLLEKCWDLRVFGFLIPIPGKDEKEEGSSIKSTSIKSIGPTQVSFGISLNKVEKIDVTITNVMASKEEKKKGGSIGKKYAVPVAIVEHFIFINDITAKETNMSEYDYKLLIEALQNLKLAPTLSTSSKNSTPLLIVEIEFCNEKYANFFGMLDVKEKVENPLSLRDYEIDTHKLFEKLNELKVNPTSNASNTQQQTQTDKEKIINEFKVYIKKEYKDIFKLPQEINPILF
ncbi:MAG: CRISPR-associated protein [candidate division WOR-3 bacterium]